MFSVDTEKAHSTEDRCSLIAIETLRNRSNVVHIRYLANRGFGKQIKSNRDFGRTTYSEKVPSTLKPLNFALGQSGIKGVNCQEGKGEVENADFVLDPCGIVHSRGSCAYVSAG